MENSIRTFLKNSGIGAAGITIAVILSVQLLSCTQNQKEISYFDTQPNID
jgi:hypothetical protein